MQPTSKQDHTINAPVSLEPGIYVNIFPVTFPEESVHFMVTSRGSFPDLRSLRKLIQDEDWNTQVYAHGNKVYGYGAEMEYLLHEGFEEEILYLTDFPQLTARLIEEGILRLLSTEGYETRVGKGRLLIFHANRSTLAANGKIKVYQGYDLRSTFWWDQFSGKLAYGLVVDVTWAIRDGHEQPLNMHQVAQLNAVTQIAQIQGEYLPGRARINTEVARQRLQEQILPFVQGHPTFELPCGVPAQLSPQPVRIIIGGDEA
jgi:hypothetical protein